MTDDFKARVSGIVTAAIIVFGVLIGILIFGAVGGTELIQRGKSHSTISNAVRWQCKSCGGYSQTSFKKQVDLR